MVTPTAQNLIRVFFLREQMKKLAGSGNKIAHVHVIGAGAMGGDIAAWCAGQDMRVTLADMKAEPIAGAIKRAADLFGKILRKRTDVRDALDRLMPDMGGEGVRNADLIIEAVPEKLELKQKVYAGLEPKMKPGAILATNTSSIPLQDLRTTLQKPERLLGLHFFNPVSRLQLVEVVSHDGTDAQLLKEALAFVGAIDRLPLPVKSLAGLSRQPRADALHAGSDGDAGREDRQVGHRCRGEKVRHADGPDRTRRSGRPRYLPRCRRHAALEVRRHAAADAGLAARKSRQGRTRPQDRQGLLHLEGRQGRYHAASPSTSEPSAEMIDRLILPMSNVCVACLREGIVDNADVVDGAVIFGTGYAPFRGGPLNYARTPRRGERGLDACAR